MRKVVKVLEPEEWDRWYDSIKVNNLATSLGFTPEEHVAPNTDEGDLANNQAGVPKAEGVLE
jgi:hypothetical protein